MSWWGGGEPQAVVYAELPSPQTREDFERLADQCFDDLMRLDAEGPDAGWTSIPFEASNGEEEVRLWDKSVAGSAVNCLKAEASMPCSAKNLFDLLCEEDLKKRQEYEKDCTCYEIVCQITPEIAVTRARYSAPFPVKAREVVSIRVRRRLSGGGFVSFGKSINFNECLTDSSHVRAAVHLVGSICRPIPGEPNRCILTRIAQLDPKGNIPTVVVNATKKKGGASMILLRKVIRKRNFPPAEEEEEVAEEPASEGDQDQVKLEPLPKGEGEDAQQKVSGQQEESIKAPRQPPSIKGKERVGDDSSTAPILGDEIFYEAATSLPWDERPLRQMYDKHRDEVKHIVSSLQESLGRLEELAQSNERRLQSIERLYDEMNRPSGAQRSAGTVHLTNLSWGSLAFLAAWPVVAYAVYDFVSSRARSRRK